MHKGDKELNGKTGSTGKVVFYSWLTTIPMEMVVWKDIHKHMRCIDKSNALEKFFDEIRTREGIFARAGYKPKWNLIALSTFLPHHLLSESLHELDSIPQRSASNTSSSSEETLDEELEVAVDDFFRDVLEALALHANFPILSIEDTNQEQLLLPDTNIQKNDQET